jgi:hypothetical protein
MSVMTFQRTRNLEPFLNRLRVDEVGIAQIFNDSAHQLNVENLVFNVEDLSPCVSAAVANRDGAQVFFAAASLATGSSTQNLLPRPTVLSNPILPSTASISRRLIVSPMSVPSSCVSSTPRRLNGSNTSWWRSTGMECPTTEWSRWTGPEPVFIADLLPVMVNIDRQ